MIEVNVINIASINYYIVETIEIDMGKYFVLVNESNNEDVCIRKVIVENNQEYLVKLDNEEELVSVLQKFVDKYIEKEG